MLKQQFLLLFLFASLIGIGQDKDCLAFKGTGETYQKMRLDTRTELLFAFTEQKMRTYLKEKDLIEAYAGLTYLENGFYLLNLELKLAIANAPELYGYLPARTQMVFHFLDGNQVKLRINKEVRGTFDKKEKTYLYQLEYPLAANLIKHLKVKELDRISINWSTGKEEYEIYDVDFFIRHFRCLANYQ
ncbi:MAG: hypothetical protein AAFP82_13390 [Bacteroidota bacterium]